MTGHGRGKVGAGVLSDSNHSGRVGIVIGSLQRGGTETHLAQILPPLRDRGWDVSVFNIGRDGPIRAELEEAGIAVFGQRCANTDRMPKAVARPIKLLRMLPSYWRFVSRHRGGILHFFLPEAVLIGATLALPWRRKMMMSRRGLVTYREKYPPFIAGLERFLQRRMVLSLANSRAVADELLADGLPGERVELIHNGLDVQRLRAPGADRSAGRLALGVCEQSVVFVVVANLIPYKGHEDLLKAFGHLKAGARLPEDWALVIIGKDIPSRSGGRRSELTELAVSQGIVENVKFLGARRDVPELLRAADIGVLPSHEEGFSNALIEKMGAGLAIVATAVGGNPEALADGEVGILVPPGAPVEMAEAIASLIEAPQTCLRLGQMAQARAWKHYTLAQCVDRYDAAYRRVLDGG